MWFSRFSVDNINAVLGYRRSVSNTRLKWVRQHHAVHVQCNAVPCRATWLCPKRYAHARCPAMLKSISVPFDVVSRYASLTMLKSTSIAIPLQVSIFVLKKCSFNSVANALSHAHLFGDQREGELQTKLSRSGS